MKMLRIWILGAVLAPAAVCGQNLVPNWSFEDYDDCPDASHQMSRATGWSAFRLSPDYFNACDTGVLAGVPLNAAGFQLAFDGQAYAGVASYNPNLVNGSREFIGTELSQQLVPGIPVYVSFWASSGGLEGLWPMIWATSGLGITFTNDSIYPNFGVPLPNSAAVSMSQVLSDTVNWVNVSGTVIPDSAYRFVMLGNFFSDSLITVDTLDAAGSYPGAYALIDGVCVSYNPLDCGVGQTVTTQGAGSAMSIWPNPVRDVLHVALPETDSGPASLEACDGLGRIFWSQRITGTKLSIDVSDWPVGIFILRLTHGGTMGITRKLVHTTN